MEKLRNISKNKPFIVGFILVIVLFFYLESISPYNFLKDDNLNQFFPVLVEAFRQMFSGSLPVFNQYQYTGTPIIEPGTYAIFYPPLVFSYFVANYIFGDVFLIFEVFAFIHIILGYLAVFLFLKIRKVSNVVAMIGGISFAFSGYVLIASSNWYYVLPSLFFIPFLFYLDHRILLSKSLYPIIFLGLIRAIYFYSGNAQYFVYTLIFEFLYILLVIHREKFDFSRNFRKYFTSLVLTFILVLPLFFAQLDLSLDSTRTERSPLDFLLTTPSHPFDVLFGQLLPYPLVKSKETFAKAPESFINIYYYGSLLFIFSLVGLFFYLRRYKTKFLKYSDPLLILALFSLLLSLGWRGFVYVLGVVMPLYNSFGFPFRFTLYTTFFFSMFGAVILSDYFRKINKSKRLIGFFIFLFLFFLILLHVKVSSDVAWRYSEDKVPLGLPFDFNFGDGRVITTSYLTDSEYYIKNDRDITDLYSSSYLTHNFASYFGIYHLGGYEPLNHKAVSKNIPIEREAIRETLNINNLMEYGVRWILLPSSSLSEHRELFSYDVVYNDRQFAIVELDGAKPLVYFEDASDENIDYNINNNGYSFNLSSKNDRNVIINTIYRNNFVVYLGGEELEKSSDSFDRIRINVPAGEHVVDVVYKPKLFFYGLYLMLFLLVLFIFYLFYFRKKCSGFFSKAALAISKIFGKKKIIVLLLIFIIYSLLFFYTLTNDKSVSLVIKRSTGLNVEVGDVEFTGLDSFKTKNFNVYNSFGNTVLSVDEVFFDVDVFNSLTKLFKEKKLVFSEIQVYGLNMNLSLSEDVLSNIFEVVDNSECDLTSSNSLIDDEFDKMINADLTIIKNGYIKFNGVGFGSVDLGGIGNFSLIRKDHKYIINGDYSYCLFLHKRTKLYG